MDALEPLMGGPAWALCAALVPGLAGFAASRVIGLDAREARLTTAASALAAFFLAAGAAALYAVDGASRTVFVGLEGPGRIALELGAQVDGLTVMMLLTVTLIGAVVARYTIRYLDGDPDQARFSQWLSYTLSAVLLLIVSSNLAMLFVGWIASSHGLHKLLTHFADRPAAVLAARKKFLTSRLGDVLLIAALILTARRFGSLDFAEIFEGLEAGGAEGALPIALLLVLGAMTKSAQFPFHTWLPDSMETPTPVSALMHAGIINAGGFLLIRMSPLLVAAPEVLPPLALGGAFTAGLGSLAMLAQTDVKRKYAYSTVAQMGFMMLQCGLGAFAAAALHMVGHAFYKGYSFLSAGAWVDPRPQPAGARPARPAPGLLAATTALVLGTASVAVVATVMGIDPSRKPGLWVLGGVLALAAAQLVMSSAATSPAPIGASRAGGLIRSALGAVAIAAGVSAAYFTGVALFGGLLGAAIPDAVPMLPPVLAAAVLGIFGAAFAVQHGLATRDGRIARAAWIHASNGFYLGSFQNRWVARLWPLPR